MIEGNRGLFDGFDSRGSHSTAELAKLLGAPVIIAIAPKKVTRTVAAWVLGCKHLDPDINIAGVVLTGIAGARHRKVITEAVENDTGVPVIGAIPKVRNTDILPSRHLGLITPVEFENSGESMNELRQLFEDNVDTDRLIEIARSAPEMEAISEPEIRKPDEKFNIGYFKDRSFSFYYPENLEALERQGAQLVPINSISDTRLPEGLAGIYIGGGFPETNLDALIANRPMMRQVKRASDMGMPIYAECGGLIYLSKNLYYNGRNYEMAGIFPVDIEMNERPAGHGYSIMKIDAENPYFEIGAEIKGHEFHYTRATRLNGAETVMQTIRGSGAKNGRDGLTHKNTLATYLHLHALSGSVWAKSFARKAIEYAKKDN